MAKKNALGRGLGALIENEDTSSQKSSRNPANSGVAEIEVDLIDTNPYQPRTIFDEETLNELAGSIHEIGIIQPLTIRSGTNGKYQLISGERRLKAAKIAGLEKVPCYIRKANDQNMLEMALVENIQREDLDAIEVAISYQRLIEECKLTQESLSQRVGKKRATVTNYLRLLKLPAEIQLGIKEKKVSMGHARALVTVKEPTNQLNIYKKILDKELSVRKVEEIARKLNEEDEEKKEQTSAKKDEIKEEYKKLQSHLSQFFDSKVAFQRNTKGAGKIVISFSSDEDLERIIAIFDKLNT